MFFLYFFKDFVVIFRTCCFLSFSGFNAKISGWWFQFFVNVHPYFGKTPNLTNIFQMGWFNHQPGLFRGSDGTFSQHFASTVLLKTAKLTLTFRMAPSARRISEWNKTKNSTNQPAGGVFGVWVWGVGAS